MLRSRSTRTGALGAFALALMSGVAFAVTMSSYQAAIIPLEGGPAGFSAVNRQTNALGAFQMMPIALRDIGWQDASGQWTALARQNGVTDQASFLANPQAQVTASSAYYARNVSYLQANGAYSQWLGKTSRDGVVMTDAALSYCAQALGAGGCRTYLNTGEFGPNVLAQNPGWANGGFGRKMAGIAGTSRTDSGETDVTTGTTVNPDGTTTTTTTVDGIYCEPAIMDQLVENSRTMVDSWTTLAQRPETGYTLLGGGSVLDAAGLTGGGAGGGGGAFGGMTFGQASCLDRLNNLGINVIFGSAGIGDILGMIANAACNMATQLFSQVTQPLNQSLYRSYALGGVVPGLNLGSVGLGGSVGIGSTGGGGLVNIRNQSGATVSYAPDVGWYRSGSYRATTTYGSMFGTYR